MMMKYFTDKTDLPYYDNIIKNPEYHKRAKGLHYKIVEMSPDRYLDECASMFGSTSKYDMIDKKLVDKYKKQTLQGSPMPLITIERHARAQEGRHRAMVAKELGLKKIPVMKVWKD